MRALSVGADEALYVVTLEMDDEGEIRQAIHEAKRMPGPVFTCSFERPVQLTGASGSPIVDKNGLLVGIVTGKTLMDLGNPGDFVRSCSAHSVMELMPVIKSAVAEKGVASPAQTKTVIRKPGKRSVPSNETPPIASTSA